MKQEVPAMTVWHMNGAGNGFAVLDARGKQYDFPQLSRELCKLTGADGLMAVDTSESCDFRLHFYNSDGSRGEMCGNGARCVCRFAYETGIAGEAVTVETDAGQVRSWRISPSVYRVQLNLPSVLELQRIPGVAYTELGDPGIPHAVMELPALSWQDREALRPQAAALRFHSAFPKGANVNLFTQLAPDRVRILTYERWVEDYTLACGTGSAAVALVLWARSRLPEGRLLVHNPGGDLQVSIQAEEGAIR